MMWKEADNKDSSFSQAENESHAKILTEWKSNLHEAVQMTSYTVTQLYQNFDIVHNKKSLLNTYDGV